MSAADFAPAAEGRASQCRRLLSELRRAPVTTSQARALLGAAASPAARVLDLRRAGHHVLTLRQRCGSGFEACYVLEADAL